MNENDGVQIPIITTADTTGAKQQAAALQQLADTSKAANKQIATAEAETGKAAVGWKKEYKEALHRLGEEFPMVTAAARLFLNGISAATVLAGIGIRRVAADIEALNASLTTAEWEKYGDLVAARKKNFDDAALSAAGFARELGRIRTEAESATAKADKLMQVHKAQSGAEDQLDEARKKVETSKVEATEVDPVRKAQKLLEIEEKYAAKKKARQDADSFFELTEMHRRLANEEISARDLGEQLKQARERKTALGTEEDINKRLETERGRLKASDDDLIKKRERLTELEGMGWAFRSTAQEHEMNRLRETIPGMESARDRQAQFVRRLEGQAPGEINAIRAAGETVSNLEGQERGATARATETRNALGTQTSLYNIGRAARGQDAGLNTQAAQNAAMAAIGQTPEGKTMLDASAAADAMLAGKKTDQATQQWILGLARLLTNQNITMQQALQLIATSNDNFENLRRDVEQLRRQQAALASRTRVTMGAN